MKTGYVSLLLLKRNVTKGSFLCNNLCFEVTPSTLRSLLLQMSQNNDSENDIWEYKPLEKKRKNNKSCVSKRRCTAGKTSKDTSPSLRAQGKRAKPKAAESGESAAVGDADENTLLLSNELPIKSSATEKIRSDCNAVERQMSEEFCPICQMPFHILVVQSQRWHVAECLETLRDECKGKDPPVILTVPCIDIYIHLSPSTTTNINVCYLYLYKENKKKVCSLCSSYSLGK